MRVKAGWPLALNGQIISPGDILRVHREMVEALIALMVRCGGLTDFLPFRFVQVQE